MITWARILRKYFHGQRSSLSEDSNIMSLLQREHNKIFAKIGVGYVKRAIMTKPTIFTVTIRAVEWTGNREVTGSNLARCSTGAIGEEGIFG